MKIDELKLKLESAATEPNGHKMIIRLIKLSQNKSGRVETLSC